MTILLAYFVWVACTFAVIVTAWIGVGESGDQRLHLQRADLIQHSYDASVMAEDDDTPRRMAAAPPAKPSASHADERRTAARLHRRHGFDPRVALRAMPPDDGH
ncbi:MAG TPA: hypothetical protein VMC05_07750 [Xanthobacteraceae bacterium]|nr:hypothetical protein [Xanthobacteraceae bacterium]